MGKLLSWVVLIALAWLVIRLIAISQRRREGSVGASGSAGGGAPRGARSASAGRGIQSEPIVPCAHCGLFVPASDAIRDDGRDYCSAAHRDADRSRRPASGEGAPRARAPGETPP
ncbi:MAG: hypothetical protein M9885_11545 [Burkholderiaceae bacterium]|nr:hypothetical protein [Burkholderiaceae bacterium]